MTSEMTSDNFSKFTVRVPVSSPEVFNSEEFKAFALKFGILINLQAAAITIYVEQEVMTVVQNYLGSKPTEPMIESDYTQCGDGE